MSPEWQDRLKLSQHLFVRVAWPELGPRWFPGAELQVVETVDNPVLKMLDRDAGVDYVVRYDNGVLQGLASRVQTAGTFDSFTVGKPELAKRREALRRGGIGPEYFIQSYVDAQESRLVWALRTRTVDIVRFIDQQNGANERRNRNTGATFYVVQATDLIAMSRLDPKVDRWTLFDAQVNGGVPGVKMNSSLTTGGTTSA